MSLPILLNFRVLSNRPSAVSGGAFVELIVSSFAGSTLDSGARFQCEFHPDAKNGAHWGIYPPEVRSDSRLSLWGMLLGSNPTVACDGEPTSRQELVLHSLSNTLNTMMLDTVTQQRSAIQPHELASFVDNKVFALTFPNDQSNLLFFQPTGISQADMTATFASLSPLFAKGPRYHLEAVNSDTARATEIIEFKQTMN